MYKFSISAPGSLFLLGEHMKMHENKKAFVMTSLNMRTKLTFTSLPPNAVKMDFIELIFPNIQLHMKIPLNPFLFHFFNNNTDKTIGAHTLYEKVKIYVSSLMGNNNTCDLILGQHESSLQTFFFLLVYIAYRHIIKITASFIVKISSDLPIGEGMGSSTSFGTCLAACFWRWSLLQKGIARYEFHAEDTSVISGCVAICERIVYKSTTSFNIVVSVHGSLLILKQNSMIKKYDHFPSIKILLVCSNVKQKDVQMHVDTRHSQEFALNNISALAKASIKVFKEIKKMVTDLGQVALDDPSNLTLRTLSDIVRINQELLNSLGISHPNLDIICAIAQNHSLSGKMACLNKYGYAFILLLPSVTDDDIAKLIDELKSHNFDASITSLCGESSGVRVE
ncbi:mevalonate kinase-like [Pogonomyrmex barbatus]|uniref:Mevalonate kinase-like n=1 Tax=Pogonomyrmex barbatus TaxID=144034 RepID=A0A6I9X5F5_9HYME|nr:mevalonate kinase-like [Pogonomyrmex barbatus]XP_011639708.1 mevalonate kinase-like [Pogonomyrmex barbatus]